MTFRASLTIMVSSFILKLFVYFVPFTTRPHAMQSLPAVSWFTATVSTPLTSFRHWTHYLLTTSFSVKPLTCSSTAHMTFVSSISQESTTLLQTPCWGQTLTLEHLLTIHRFEPYHRVKCGEVFSLQPPRDQLGASQKWTYPRIGKSIWELLKGFLCNIFGIDQ